MLFCVPNAITLTNVPMVAEPAHGSDPYSVRKFHAGEVLFQIAGTWSLTSKVAGLQNAVSISDTWAQLQFADSYNAFVSIWQDSE